MTGAALIPPSLAATFRGVGKTLRVGLLVSLMSVGWPLGCGGSTSDSSAGSSGAEGGASGAAADGGSGGEAGGGAGTAGSAGSGNGGAGAAGAGGSKGGSGGAKGGSGGTLEEDWFACKDTSECVVRRNQCCELCGPSGGDDAIAVHRDHRAELGEQLCLNQDEPCPDVDCALQPSYVLPFCIEGKCTAVDIRKDKLTSCGDDGQCRLRWDTTCCEACSSSEELLVAVNNQLDWEKTVCGEEFTACPPCAPPEYPPNARAVCGPDFFCRVQWD